MNNTHSAFISGEIGGSKFTAFVDGIPDKCEHDDNGEILSFNHLGQYFKDSEMPNPQTDYDAWVEFQEKHKINGGCVSCSKCGKPFEPDFFNMP